MNLPADVHEFYSTPGLMTDPGELRSLFDDLPSDLPALCQTVQGLLVHPLTTELFSVDLSSTQKKEVNIRPVREMLRLIQRFDPRPLVEARPANERLVGNCRDHAVLLTAMLRHQGRPARVHPGFAAYLNDQSKPDAMISDHWIVEVWDAARGRWQWVDPQIDPVLSKHLKITFDPTDIPAGQFYTAAGAWTLCRKKKAKSGRFGFNRKARGWHFMRGQLMRELASMNKVEVLPWDVWWTLASKDETDVTADERKFFDSIAAALTGLEATFDDLRALFDDARMRQPLESKLVVLGLAPQAAPTADSVDPAQPDQPAAPHKDFQPSDLTRLSLLARSGTAEASAAHPAGSNGSTSLNGYTNGVVNPNSIVVRGAQQHNLKHVNVTIPRDRLVVLTGVSGSGKSSLAFDTLYAEGQRRYVESLSAYVRRFMDQMDKPKVDYIGGLSPAISIEQKSVSKNPRSTVGTITEVMDYMRVLFSRAGTQHCPQCARAIEPISPQVTADRLAQLPGGARFQLIAPLARNRKGDHMGMLDRAHQEGFTRARIDGQPYDLDQPKTLPRLPKSKPHTLEIIVDRLVVPSDDALRKEFAARVIDSVETALRAGHGTLVVDFPEGLHDPQPFELRLSEGNACPHCDISLPPLSPALFSFNAPTGMCPDCNGLGASMEVDTGLIIEHPEISLMDGASRWYGNVRKKKNSWHIKHLEALGKHYGVDLELPWKDLPQRFRDVILYGSDGEKIHFSFENAEGTWKGEVEQVERGAVHNINRLFRQTQSEYTRRWYMSFMSQQPCPSCGGTRLCAEARYATLGGSTFPQVLNMTIEEAHKWVSSLSVDANGSSLSPEQMEVVGEVLKELRARLRFMLDVGLHYLSLARPAPSLSGGEGQRIRLASQLGCGLVGVLYILDEPSIGLHARDQRNLLNTLLKLRDMGNTVLVVEHDEETMRAADWLIDLGPGAGVMGGEVVAEGPPQQIAEGAVQADARGEPHRSLTARYLAGLERVSAPGGLAPDGSMRRRDPRGWITLGGARLFNLKNVTARFPLGTVTVVTGVSGSGKSSLVADTLYPALARSLMGAQSSPGPFDRLEGLEQLDKVINITQEPIGRTPRSNPATYTGLFDEIRQAFAATPEARMRGYGSDRFSFNVKGGRCESCRGHGWKKVEMHFLPDVWVVCQECKGARYNRHTLEVTYKGKNIAEALDMDVQEALEFFSAFPKLTRVLQTLHDVGLDYVKLGQSATTLSGGEAQRVKLAKELGRISTGDTIYILDEPTTGLHFADVQRLLDVLHRLADAGNTVIIIEHNMDVIRTADWLIDLGPEGGAAGGQIIAEGTPEDVAAVEASYTGQHLKMVLEGVLLLT